MRERNSSNCGPAGGLRLAMVLGFIVLAFGVPAVAAATPPEPTSGSATVDGNPGEWNLTTDYFAEMRQAWRADKPLQGKLYLRFSCATNTLYALVLTEPGVTIDTGGDQYVQVPKPNFIINKGVPPFVYVMSGAKVVGWEASGPLVPPSNPYSSTLRAHAQILDTVGQSQTSGVVGQEIPFTINCSPTAVTLAGMSAQSAASFPLAGAALLVVGMVGAGVVAWRRRR